MSRPLKIGMCCYPTYGGSGVLASELANGLARRGDEVHVLSYDLPPRLEADRDGRRQVGQATFHRVDIKEYPLFQYPPYSLALATKIVDVAHHVDLDLMHVHYAVPNAVSAVLARQILESNEPKARYLPIVTTLHGTDVTLVGRDPTYLETTRFGILESDLVTAVSRSLAETTRQQLSVDCPIVTVPNFIEPERFAASACERIDPRPTVLHVSNFRRVKRAPDVARTFITLKQQLDCRLILIGDGPELGEVEGLLREAELSISHSDVAIGDIEHNTDVLLLGEVDEIEQIYHEADVLLLPSEQEAFGLAALEAMASGVPVVATDVGGLPEVVVSGKTGFLAPLDDLDSLCKRTFQLLADSELRARFGEAGKQRARDLFEREQAIDRYRGLYQELLTRVKQDRGENRETA